MHFFAFKDFNNSDIETTPNLEARRFARRQISETVCERYSHVIGQLGDQEGDFRGYQHHSPPVRLTSASRSHLDQDFTFYKLENCQSTLESMEVPLTAEQKISSKRGLCASY